jgi:peptide/nickel transport system substrate-binding protein
MNGAPRRLRGPGAICLAALTLLTLAACTGTNNNSSTGSSAQNSPSGSPVDGGTVTVAEPAATVPNWIFPMASLAYFSVENFSNFQYPMYRPLYWFGGNNLDPTVDYSMSVANQPQYSSSGTTVTLNIKPWKWSNGETVTADDVIFWLNMLKTEKANWAGYTPGQFPDNVTKITKVDNQTVELTLDKAYSHDWFTYNQLSQITPMPMAWDVTSVGAKAGSGGCAQSISNCKAVYDFLVSQAKDLKSYATSKIWSVVDGPFKLKSFDPAGNYSFVPNPTYSGSPKPRLDEIKFLPFTTDSAEYNVLKAGGTIDVGYIPPQDLSQKPSGADVPSTNPAGPNYYMLPAFNWQVSYYTPNFNNPTLGPAFKQLYVRQALAMTLDQQLVVDKAFKGYGYPNFSPVPVKPDNQWLSPAARKGTPYPFDPAKAKSLLTDHGWTLQNGVMTCTSPGTASNQCGAGVTKGTALSIKFDYASGTPSLDQQMQQYKSDAAKAGIVLNLKQAPFNSVIGEAVPCKPSDATCSWQMADWGGGWIYSPDYLPTGELLFQTGAGSNSGSYSDPQMDKLIAATTTTSGTQPLYSYEDYASQQLPVLFQPVAYVVNAVSKNVGGVVYNPLTSLNAEYWYRTK